MMSEARRPHTSQQNRNSYWKDGRRCRTEPPSAALPPCWPLWLLRSSAPPPTPRRRLFTDLTSSASLSVTEPARATAPTYAGTNIQDSDFFGSEWITGNPVGNQGHRHIPHLGQHRARRVCVVVGVA